jgi:Rieske Fe-S protein
MQPQPPNLHQRVQVNNCRIVKRQQRTARAAEEEARRAAEDPLYQSRASNRTFLHQFRQAYRASMVARVPNFLEADVHLHNVGAMDQTCQHCGAKMWVGERVPGGFTMCCMKGKVDLSHRFS